MKSVETLSQILKLNEAVFKTSDAAGLWNISNAHASKTLARLAEAGHVVKLSRSVWAVAGKVDKLAVPEHLTTPWPSYISLQTALYHHGMISQIPQTVYAVSMARSKKYDTPLGLFSIHHIASNFFFGFETTGKGGIKLAEPEKALIDTLYLSPAKSNLFKTLPEIEFPSSFSRKKAFAIINKIEAPRRRTLVKKLFEKLTHEI